MKFCTGCGKKLPDVAAFCPYCGKKQAVSGTVEEKKATVVAPAPEARAEPAKPVKKPAETSLKDRRAAAKSFFLQEEPLKMQLIFLGALFGVTFIFWIIRVFIPVAVIFKVLLMLFTGFRVYRAVFPFVKKIRNKGEKDWFDLLLYGALVTANSLLLILSFVFLGM